MILKIELKSKARRDAALDNVAGFWERTENGWGMRRGAKWLVEVLIFEQKVTKDTKYLGAFQLLSGTSLPGERRGPPQTRS